ALKFPNVYLGTAAYPPRHWPAVITDFLRGPGRGKVVFGTNFPTVGHRHALHQLAELDLDADVESALLGGAARAVFHRLFAQGGATRGSAGPQPPRRSPPSKRTRAPCQPARSPAASNIATSTPTRWPPRTPTTRATWRNSRRSRPRVDSSTRASPSTSVGPTMVTSTCASTCSTTSRTTTTSTSHCRRARSR